MIIEDAVNRFLSWPLPKDFNPDAGVSFKPGLSWPTGTNLLTAVQARAMLEHVIGEQPKRKPLTKQQIKAALADMSSLQMPIGDLIEAIVRATERAHEIE